MIGMRDTMQALYNYVTVSCTEPVRDPLWGTILFPPGFMQLRQVHEFQKLSRIKQLGPTHLVYPGAVHTRLSHSMGVYEIARRMLLVLMKHPDPHFSPIWSMTGIKSFLSAALLHDLGHFPFTHSLKDLSLTSHETLAADIIMNDKQLYRVLKEEIGADPWMTAAIIDDSIDSDSAEVLMYRTILSGTLDPDKLDYLNRDAFFCGVPYGLQDVDFILTKILLTDHGTLGIEELGISSIEHLIFSKYLMYRNVYWNKSVRSATAMIRKALYLGLNDGVITPKDLYGLDDETFRQSLTVCDYPAFSVIKQVTNNQLYHLNLTIPFEKAAPYRERLRDHTARFTAEEALRMRINKKVRHALAPWQVIIDIPEPISFESHVEIVSTSEKNTTFLDTEPIFTKPVIDRFTQVLTTIRIFLPCDIALSESDLFDVMS